MHALNILELLDCTLLSIDVCHAMVDINFHYSDADINLQFSTFINFINADDFNLEISHHMVESPHLPFIDAVLSA